MGKRRGQGGEPREDQFGEISISQDKQHFSGFNSGKGLTGGGSAGKTAADEDEPVVLGDGKAGKPGQDGANDDVEEPEEDNIEVDALKRAIADNPELAREFEGTLTSKLKQAEAVEEKERGNSLFGRKKYPEAVASFSRCIELDPSCEVYFSNRSAALAALERWEEAAGDAKRVVTLKPNWAKGWARLGAACMGLKLYGDAREAYEKAVRLEPDDQGLQKACEKAETMELQQMREGKHTFKKMRAGDSARGPDRAGAGGGRAADGNGRERSGPGGSGSGSGAGASQPRNNANKRILSFAAEEDE